MARTAPTHEANHYLESRRRFRDLQADLANLEQLVPRKEDAAAEARYRERLKKLGDLSAPLNLLEVIDMANAEAARRSLVGGRKELEEQLAVAKAEMDTDWEAVVKAASG
jgi:hypothetical protein